MTGLAVAGLAARVALPSESVRADRFAAALGTSRRARDQALLRSPTIASSRAKSADALGADALAGVGPVRRSASLTAFGSPAGIRRAALDEIAAVKGCGRPRWPQGPAELEGGYRS